ncbi:MAG: hypothetical protein ACP5KO_06190 [Caldimicrobium sp.]
MANLIMEIERLCREYSLARAELKEEVEALNEEIERLKRERLPQNKISSPLSKSAYVIIKLSDLKIQLKTQQITQDEYDEQLTKYQPILHQRKQIRDWEAEVIKELKRPRI